MNYAIFVFLYFFRFKSCSRVKKQFVGPSRLMFNVSTFLIKKRERERGSLYLPMEKDLEEALGMNGDTKLPL